MGDGNRLATPIAVIGMAARFPGADDVAQYWSNLVAGVESITRDPDLAGAAADRTFVRAVGKVASVEMFDAEFFRIPPAEATVMDPQARMLLELSAAALEDAGYAIPSDHVIGVIVGAGENLYYKQNILPNGELRESYGELRLALANESDFLAPRIAYKLGLRGPSLSVQSSCATGLTAVALACQAIAAGDCDIAIAGAASLLMPDVDGYLYTDGGINSADGRCRAFAAGASGPVPGSGAGVVVLKRDSLARADGDHRYAVIRGWAINNDGGTRAGFTVPNVVGQQTAVATAMRRAGVEPREVSYLEAHGTGTPLGDPIEVEALSRVFATDDRGPRSCAIGSVKTNIGHTDAAAGIAGLIKAVLAVRTATIPASLHFDEPNPDIDFDATTLYVNTATRAWPDADRARIAGVSAFGLGGTNAHVIVSNADEPEAGPSARQECPIVVSARNDRDLRRLKALLAQHLDGIGAHPSSTFADVSHTLAVGRASLACRWAGSFAGPAEAAAALREPEGAGAATAPAAIVIEGNPEQLVAMVVRLTAAEPLIAQAAAEVVALLGFAEPAEMFANQPALRAGRAAAAACLMAMDSAGLTLTEVRGPDWAAPVVAWWAGGGSCDELAGAVRSDDAGSRMAGSGGVPDTLPGAVVLGPAFRLGAVLARAWAGGVPVRWVQFFRGEALRRVPLPTHPFTRQRFWVEPVVTPAAAGELPQPATAEVRTAGVTEVVAAAWRDVLGFDEIEHDANFFDLGGDSIVAVEIGARINETLDLSLPLDLAFQTSTIAEMAQHIDASRSERNVV